MSTIRKQAMNWWNDLSEDEKQVHMKVYFKSTNQTSELVLLEYDVEKIYLGQDTPVNERKMSNLKYMDSIRGIME